MDCFIKLLKKYRFLKSLSQEQLAHKLEVSIMTIHRWEKGTHKPSQEDRRKIEEIINDDNVFIDPYEVLTEEICTLQNKIDELKIYLEKFHS